MKNIKIFPKVMLYIAVLSGALWFGSYFIRLSISYQIFEGTDFSLRSYLNDGNLPAVLKNFQPIIISNLILYSIFVVTFILFVITSKISLKENGWLFIVLVIVIITLPMESYLLYIDYNMVQLISSNSFDGKEIVALIIKRFKIFSSFPIIELFCYAAIIYFITFQPLTKKRELK